MHWGSRAIELAEKLGTTETLVHALNNVGTAELLAHYESGRIKLEESLRLGLANNYQDHVARAYTNLASATVRDRTYRLAIRYLGDGITYTTERDLDFYKLYMTAWRARVHFEQGDWDSAADDAAFVLKQCSATYESVAATLMPRDCWLRLASWQFTPESCNASAPSLQRARSLHGLKVTLNRL